MAVVAGPLHPVSAMTDDQLLDTRTPSPVQRGSGSSSAESKNGDYKPDLSAEVALLSTKLVNAINYNTNLDDTLQASRHELDQQRLRCAALEAEKKKHDDLVSDGILVNKAEVDKVISRLRAEVASEKAARESAEKAKKQTEGELENLTSALFEEANSMVAAARKDTEAMERRNAQLKGQLQDTETVMASQQEQLQDLKAALEKLQESQPGRSPSMPSTPVTTGTAVLDALQLSPNSAGLVDSPPEHPLHFSQLISPVLRSDTTAFVDFQDLLLLTKRYGAHSRNPSTNGPQQSSTLSTYANVAAASSSSPNLPGAFSFSNNSSPVSSSPMSSIPALKESKFYKRALSEDIEPTLRLDLAPGLSFLSRRTVLGSLLAGTLAVEPYPQNKHYFACTLCGEGRRTETYLRRHRFRTSEDDSVSKPLCEYCVSRLRATCDFVGFLRMVRDGYWKCDTEEDQKSAWEESVRLRERMFWSRLGGGVVPCLQLTPQKLDGTPSSAAAAKSGRPSLESIPEGQAKASTEATPVGKQPVDVEAVPKSNNAIGQAIVHMSGTAVAVSTPEMQPAQHRVADPVTPPQSSHLSSEEAVDATSSQPPTPFEDAAQEVEMPLEAADTESDQSEHELKADTESASTSAPKQPTRDSLDPSLAVRSRESTPRSSFQADQPNHESRNSSVQDRIRALRAAAGQQ